MATRLLAWLWAAVLVVALLPITPVAASAPVVSLSTASLDLGQVSWLHKATRTVTLTNTGDAPLTDLFADVGNQQFAPIDFAVPHQPCATPIAPGGQCQIPVDFTPQSGGPRGDTVSIYDNAADSPQKVAVSGTGTGAVVRFTPDSLQFAAIPVGTTSAPQTFSAVDAGDAPVTILSVTLSPAASASKWFAITSDGCTGKTLGPGQRCSVSATATPDAVTSAIQDVYFFDNAGTGQQVYDFDKSADGLQASGGGPLLDAGEPIPAFIQDAGTTSAPTRVTVRDSGTETLRIASVALDNPSAGFSITADTCTGATLVLDTLFTPPSNCHVDVTFAPTAGGSIDANLVFHDNEFGGSHNVRLRASGLAPAAELSPTAIDFGFQPVGVQSAPQTITLTNPTSQALTVSGISGASSSIFALVNDTCTGATVPAGGACSVGVAFTAPFTSLFTTTLSFSDNAPRSPQTVSVRGEGQSPTFTISTSQIHFGDLRARSASQPQTVTVTNTSAGPLSLFFLQTNLALTHTGCTDPLAAGASCSITLVITPSANGPDSGLLKVVDQASNQQVVEMDWYGTSGFANLVSTIGGGGSLIQRVGDTLSGYEVLYDTGTDTLAIGHVDLSPNPVLTMTADGCSNQTLPVGGRCVISLTAHPTVAGTWNATLSIPSDAPFAPNPSTVAFGGIAAPPPQPVFFPASVSFPAQRVGAEATNVVWVDDGLLPHLGAQALTISSVTVGGPDATSFRVAWDGCSGLELLAAYSCPVAVSFDPTRRGALGASLLVNDDGGGSPQQVSLSGIGLAPAAGIAPQTADFGSVVVKSKSSPITVTVTSVGDLTLVITGEVVSGANKGDFTIVSENCKNQSLAPGASCQVVIVFRTETTGPRSAGLTFTDNAPNSPQTITLTGTGIAR